jgi:hypothetical protein
MYICMYVCNLVVYMASPSSWLCVSAAWILYPCRRRASVAK